MNYLEKAVNQQEETSIEVAKPSYEQLNLF